MKLTEEQKRAIDAAIRHFDFHEHKFADALRTLSAPVIADTAGAKPDSKYTHPGCEVCACPNGVCQAERATEVPDTDVILIDLDHYIGSSEERSVRVPRRLLVDARAALASPAIDAAGASNAPFSNCQFRECDLPGQCRSEGKCHHPRSEGASSDDVRDAARYRWLRDQNNSLETRQYDKGICNGPSCYHEVEGIVELKHGHELDEAIDAAIKKESGK